MLSVLIPVKDWNPLSLVESLAAQLIKCGQPYEILISDDSDPAQSAEISPGLGQIPGAVHYCREKPLGRSANRNFLAGKAQYDYLLFIDGDAGMASDDFIQNYITHLHADTVLCGGTLYHETPPDNPDCLLRWKYGRAREQVDAAERQRRSWKSFSTFNFVVPAAAFNKVRFDETIRGYGHEDTLFGIRMHESGVEMVHINNGLLHLGLETSSVYLDKIRESGANLYRLYAGNYLPDKYIRDISLLSSWIRFRRLRITPLINIWFTARRKSLEKRLCSSDPSLFLLDLYKLGSISHFG